jgi:hypothetical protein
MENTGTHLAYVLTAVGVAADVDNGPKVTVTELPENGSATVVDVYRLGAYAALGDGRLRLAAEGWRVLGDDEELSTGHYLLHVEKI